MKHRAASLSQNAGNGSLRSVRLPWGRNLSDNAGISGRFAAPPGWLLVKDE
jgi:hypothetical protein